MTPELQNLLDTKAKEIIERITANLKSRKVIGQTLLVKKISYDIQENNNFVVINFLFYRVKRGWIRENENTVFSVKKGGFNPKANPVFRIRDPLFNEDRKEFIVFDRGRLAFTKKADIFMNLSEKYFDEIINDVTQQKIEDIGFKITKLLLEE